MDEKTKVEQDKEAIEKGEEALRGLKSLAAEVGDQRPPISKSWENAALGDEIRASLPVLPERLSVEESFEKAGLVVEIPPNPKDITEKDVHESIESGFLLEILGISKEKLDILPFDELMGGLKKHITRQRRSLNHRLRTAISVADKNGIPLEVSWGMGDEELDFKNRVPGKILPRSAVEVARERESPEGAIKPVKEERERTFGTPLLPVYKTTGRGKRTHAVGADGNVSATPSAIDKEAAEKDEVFNPSLEDGKLSEGAFPRFTDDRHSAPMKKEYCRFVIDPSDLYGQRISVKGKGVMSEPWGKVEPFSMEETLGAVELLRHVSLDEVKAWWTCPDFPSMVHSPGSGEPIFKVKEPDKGETSSQVGLDVSMTGYDGSAVLLKRAMGQPDFARRLAKTIEIVLEMYGKIEGEIEEIETPLSFKIRRGVGEVVDTGRERLGRVLAKAGEYLHGWAWKRVVPEKKKKVNYKSYVKGE